MDQGSKKRNQERGWIERAYAWACERLYHEFAWSYDLVSWVVSGGRWSRWREASLLYMAQKKPDGSAARTLEIGFGTGELLITMARAQHEIFGLELSPAMHRVTDKKLARKRLAIPRVQASAQQIPYATASFDTIISTFPAPYILDPSTLRECRRILAPSGRLLIVGLWTTIDHPWLRKLPLFYGEPNQIMCDALYQRLAQADLHAEFLMHKDGITQVSVVVARTEA